MNFGEKAARHTIILFTHKDQVKAKTLDDFVRECSDSWVPFRKYRGRYHSFNNNNKDNQYHVLELLKMIDEVVEEIGGEYTNEIYKETQRLNNLEIFKEGQTNLSIATRVYAFTKGYKRSSGRSSTSRNRTIRNSSKILCRSSSSSGCNIRSGSSLFSNLSNFHQGRPRSYNKITCIYAT